MILLIKLPGRSYNIKSRDYVMKMKFLFGLIIIVVIINIWISLSLNDSTKTMSSNQPYSSKNTIKQEPKAKIYTNTKPTTSPVESPKTITDNSTEDNFIPNRNDPPEGTLEGKVQSLFLDY